MKKIDKIVIALSIALSGPVFADTSYYWSGESSYNDQIQIEIEEDRAYYEQMESQIKLDEAECERIDNEGGPTSDWYDSHCTTDW